MDALASSPGNVSWLKQFGQNESNRWVSLIFEKQSQWIQRSPNKDSFYTLGVATYMDLAPPGCNVSVYMERLRRSNENLVNGFSELLEKLRMAIERYTGNRATYVDNLPLPGFHIWLARGIPRRPTASLHFDLQYRSLVLNRLIPEPEKRLSFTLPLALPREGSGLLMWDLDKKWLFEGNRALPLSKIVEQKKCYHLLYEVGTLLIHSGDVAHQIAPTYRVYDTDVRVTLQGHAVFFGNRWTLYW
jgi:hypothetical protein